jgi:hypothetical protein
MVVSGLSIGGFAIVGITLFVCVGGLLLWLLANKKKYSFVFLLYSTDLKSSNIIKAKIVKDKNNDKLRHFVFKENNSKLEVREPNGFFNGKPVREITFDNTGDYVYLSKQKSEGFVNYSMDPTDKNLYLHMMKDNANKYPLIDKSVMMAFAGLIIIGIFIVVGFIYVFASHVKMGAMLQDTASTIKDISSTNIGIADAQLRTSENLLLVASAQSNSTIKRDLGGTIISGD